MRTLRQAFITSLLLITVTSVASAQRLLDWPVRTSAEPTAIVRGPEAAFWNPAAVAHSSGRGELIITDQRTPSIIGLNGFAAAGSWRLDPRTTVAAGYQHVSIDDISETSTSPLPDTGQPTFSIGEDLLAVAVAHALGTGVSARASFRYERSNESGVNESSTVLGAGMLASLRTVGRPVAGASVFTQNGDIRYVLGLQAGVNMGADIEMRGGYGVRGGENLVALEHRIGITGIWRKTFSVTGGVASADAGAERSWEPVVGASLRVSRYELGVLRENLGSNFGAAYSFRFRLGLK